MQVSSHEIEGQKGRISELHLKNQIHQNELAEQRAVTKLQEEQLSLLKDEVRSLKRGTLNNQDLEGKVRDLEQTLVIQHKCSNEKSQQIDALRSSIRTLEDQIFKASSELQQVSEEYALRAKRQALEEETLKKRLVIHEKNSKELSDRFKESEQRHTDEVEALKKEQSERIREVVQERDALREKLINVEKQLYAVKRDRDAFESENEQIRSENKSSNQSLLVRTKELSELKQNFYEI